MRKKLHHTLVTPRVLSCLAALLTVSFVIAPLRGSAFTSTDRVTRGSLDAEPRLRMTPARPVLPAPSPSPSPSPVPRPSPYDIAPSSGVQGKEYEVIVTSNECMQDASKKPINGFQLYAPGGSGIKVTGTATTDCRLTTKLSIASDAPVGIVKLWLTKADEKKNQILQDVIDFAVTGITAGPIPPGLNNKGQVDVMWSVLPDQVVHDNFGAKVATEYFCIDAVIGNDSGYDIQLASIGFTVPSFSVKTANGSQQYRIPNTGYRIVRGTLQRRELFNPRTMILNGIKIAGPLLTGFTPYFHNISHQSNFSQAINIISNPLEKGFEMLVPDTLPAQVDRLGDITYRDDISTRTIIPNNIQTRITTFVPKEIVFPGMKGKTPNPGEDRKNPMDVMHKLGDIVIIGEQIEHVNRIRVVSSGIAAAPTDQSVSGKITDSCNQGVGGVTMTLSGDSGFTSRDVTTSSDGSYAFPNVPVDRTYAVTPALANVTFSPESPGSQTFTLSDAKTNLNFRADYVVLVLTGKVKRSDAQPIKDGEISVELTGTGLDQKKTAPVNAAGVYRFELPAANLSLLTATFQLTPKSDMYTFDGAKTWKCDKRDGDFIATPIPTPSPKP